ncbi:MAG TPA: MFS transporter, partial [Acidisphaera sp.]|nr:MFS transporter [Acidisphaera sp.]
FRRVLFWNGLISTALLSVTAFFRPAWPLVAIYAVLLIGGFFRSLQFTAYNTIAYAETDRARMSAATSLYSTLQQVSLTLGITAGAAALEVAMFVSRHTEPATTDFGTAFLVVTVFCGLAAPISLLLAQDAGSELTR